MMEAFVAMAADMSGFHAQMDGGGFEGSRKREDIRT